MTKSTSTPPRFKSRWTTTSLEASDNLPQFAREIKPDLGFSTISLARKNSLTAPSTEALLFSDPLTSNSDSDGTD